MNHMQLRTEIAPLFAGRPSPFAVLVAFFPCQAPCYPRAAWSGFFPRMTPDSSPLAPAKGALRCPISFQIARAWAKGSLALLPGTLPIALQSLCMRCADATSLLHPPFLPGVMQSCPKLMAQLQLRALGTLDAWHAAALVPCVGTVATYTQSSLLCWQASAHCLSLRCHESAVT